MAVAEAEGPQELVRLYFSVEMRDETRDEKGRTITDDDDDVGG